MSGPDLISAKSKPWQRSSVLLPALALLGLMVALPSADAQEQVRDASGQTTENEVLQYCNNIADAARDRRYALQKQDLEKLQSDVNDRIAVMEKRKTEYEDWLAKRNEFMKQAENGLVDMFKTMKPDTAAPQLEAMQPPLAAAIIMRLPPRQSGLILSEMDAKKAAAVATIIASAADPNTSKDPS
ncbi:MotE family protein [Neorhizobium sp. NCHU2750]|uniref:MotE family protein n=1 Tax=Neorhizobium sp. NCHU2750 TaxID=1825976 RepID=UPI000E75D77D|nr:flagellar protein [Neorhizobium sp. NCHU2750]